MKRVFFGYMAFLMAMLSVNYLPLSVSTPAMMSTVFVTLLLSFFVAGERLSGREIMTIIMGSIGVLIVVTRFDGQIKFPGKSGPNHNFNIGVFFSIGFTICSALSNISIREIGDNIHPSIKNYYLGVIGTAITILINLYIDPGFFAIWNIGTPNYPISKG